jgi:hypothetical protein
MESSEPIRASSKTPRQKSLDLAFSLKGANASTTTLRPCATAKRWRSGSAPSYPTASSAWSWLELEYHLLNGTAPGIINRAGGLFSHAPPCAVYCNHLASLGYSCSCRGQTTTTQYVAALMPASTKMGA